MRVLKTSSGAEYEFMGEHVRRNTAESEDVKRADGEWVKLQNYQEFLSEESFVGKRLVLVVESLRRYGRDDFDTDTLVSKWTTRFTTTVVEDSWD